MDDRDPRPQGDRTYHPSSSCADRTQGDSGEETSRGPRPDTHYLFHGNTQPPTLTSGSAYRIPGVRKEEPLLAAHAP
eukprot:15270314-Heterocapsa_arctica.AAC.1